MGPSASGLPTSPSDYYYSPSLTSQKYPASQPPLPSQNNSRLPALVGDPTGWGDEGEADLFGDDAGDDAEDDTNEGIASEELRAVKDEEDAPPLPKQRQKDKEKKRRNRKPSSCVNCRKKKLRCNRVSPCNQCTLKNEPHNCLWDDATPLFDARSQHDAEELKSQVARLEDLVRYLTAQPHDHSLVPAHLLPTANSSPDLSRPSLPSSSHSSMSLPDSRSRSVYPSSSSSLPSPELVQFPSPSSATSSINIKPELDSLGDQSLYAIDLRSHDLCEALSQLAIREFVVVEGSGADSWAPGGIKGEKFVEEAKEFMLALPQRFGINVNIPPLTGLGVRSSPGTKTGEPSMFPSSLEVRECQTPGQSPASVVDIPSSLSPGPLASAAFHREAPPLSEVLKFLPTYQEAMSAYTYFTGYVSWYSHPVHLSTFESQWEHLKEALLLDDEGRAKEIDPFYIATFLGVLSMGLSMMPVSRALRDGFTVNKDKVVEHWLEGAMLALTCGKFLDNPSVEAVRATVVICTYFVFMSPGESSGAGMVLLSLSVQVAMSLGLHRDPDRSPSKFSFCEAEDRRRLFWNLFMLCILSSASLGRTWAVFDLDAVDTKLPLDCHDHEIVNEFAARAGTEARRRKSEETPMTSLLCKMKLAVMAKKLNERAFGIRPVRYSTILELDRELREFEESIPERYQLQLDSVGALIRQTQHVTVTEMRACMVQISLASEFIRLHRPWIVLASSNKQYQFSRDQAIKYAKLLLAVYRSPSCNKQRWGGLIYKSTNAAIVLAIEILSFPGGSEAASLRAVVRATTLQMESHAFESSLCRKGSRILRFLLEKDVELSSLRDQQRQTKRARNADTTTLFPSRLAAALYPAQTSSSSSIYTDDAELRHKNSSHRQSLDSSVPLPYYRSAYPIQPPLFRQRHVSDPIRPTPPAEPAPALGLRDQSFANLAGNFTFDFMMPDASSSAPPSLYGYSFQHTRPMLGPYATPAPDLTCFSGASMNDIPSASSHLPPSPSQSPSTCYTHLR